MRGLGRSAWLAVASSLLLGLVSVAARADEPCRALSSADNNYSVCQFDLRNYAIKLYWKSPAGEPYGGVAALAEALTRSHQPPVFAMNAGMYRPDYSPVGLYIEDGAQLRPANVANGPGNFHLKPNGVFFVRGTEAGILETSAYLHSRVKPDLATQSGPMLVIGGHLHPKFTRTSDSRKIRNGVGVRNANVIVFAISSEPVTFTEFAELFRDVLGCPNALFLDGSISSLYAPALQRADSWWPAGPIVAALPRNR
jgi:uncharacterized protein YigE (DUF2233 family)